MRFNCTRMESLVSGDLIPSQASFTRPVFARGSFIARIKRTGFPSKHIGSVDLLLLDSEQLAICSSPDSDNAEELFLLFPLISGAHFGDVKRHGNALTLHAMRVSLVLQATPTGCVDNNVSAFTGQWTRILNRIISGEPCPDYPSSTSYFGGLGICVNGAKYASNLRISSTLTVPKAKPLVSHTSAHPPNSLRFSTMVEGTTSMIPPVLSSGSKAIPNSRSLKRISLCLTGSTNLGFGNDLKAVLATLDKEVEEPEEPQQETHAPIEEVLSQDDQKGSSETSVKEAEAENVRVKSSAVDKLAKQKQISREESVQDIPSALLPSHPFDVPAARFHESSSSVTPSPNSLYIAIENATSATPNFAASPKRVASILAKEQQQLVQKYGNRASMFTNFVQTGSDTQLVINRQPPKIPAPMPGKELQGKTEVTEVVFKPHRENSKVSSDESPSRAGPATKKTVLISPMVQLKDSEKENSSSRHRAKSTKMSKGTFPSSTHLGSSCASNTSQSPKPEQKIGFVKVMKRMLGKNYKQNHDIRFSSVPYHRNSPELPRTANSESQCSEHFDLSDSEIEEELGMNDNSDAVGLPGLIIDEKQSLPTSESDHERHPVYVELVEPDQSPLSQKFSSRGVVADSTNNGGATMAIPKFDSQKSISALSFRSLSSRSLWSKILDQETLSIENSENTTAAPTTDHSADANISSQISKVSGATESCDKMNPDSPTFLRREPRSKVSSVPVALEGDLVPPSAKTLCENSNNSTPALISNRHSTSAKPALHLKQPSTSSSNCSLVSRRSLHSYSSSLSSASSCNTPNLLKSEIALFGANLWISAWSSAHWKPLSQLELRTEILACDFNTVKISVVDAGIMCKFTPQCEIRRAGNHDVEVKTLEETYMFRGRDPEDAQRFYTTLWIILANGVQSVATAALTKSSSCGPFKGISEEDSMQSRRRTFLPPSLSRSNQSLKYAGLYTQTIVEE